MIAPGTPSSHASSGAGDQFLDLPTMPIAIIGMACRFPGDATSPEKLWDLCANGRNAWSPIPSNRFNQAAWYHPNKEHLGTSYVKGAHFLTQDVSRFDASFFNFSAESASTMDPEVRMQLETVYEALENAGIPIEQVAASRTGVFAGTCFRDNHDSLLRDPNTLAPFYLTGNGAAMIANRISHFYDLRGPSLMVDTGCSTTLTLLHLACQSLRTGESNMAIVGGSNVLLNPDMFISGTNLSLLSAEGKCFAFDSRASGYGRGDGVASIIIKPLEAALRDGDPIRSVIRNTSANQDGKTPTLTSPSQEAQETLMRECYASAALNPVDTAYAEAHGTGTQAGDTIEAHALGTVFGNGRADEQPLVIGSVKTNIGHTEAASGLAGIIRVVMALEKGAIAPHLNYESPNEKISLDALKLKIPLTLQSWPANSLRRASVNNFGYGGANAHAILEHPEYLVPTPSSPHSLPSSPNPKARSRVFVLSAKDERATRAMVQQLQQYVSEVRQNPELNSDGLLDQLAFTLGQRRSRFAWNVSCSADSLPLLQSTLDSNQLSPRRSSRAPRLGMVFTGQGAQWYAMGRELFSAYPVFLHTMKEADECLRSMGATWSVVEELHRDPADSRVNQVSYSLPLSVAIQLSLVNLLRSWGIYPTGVTGHSSGEVGAAYAAGAISLSAAMSIVYSRGNLTSEFQRLLDSHGGMVAVGLGRKDAQAVLSRVRSGKAVIACVNSPSSVTISGDMTAIEEVEELLAQEQVFARRLKVEAAYHSHHMLPIADAYREMLSRFLQPEPGYDESIIYSSPTTGDRMYSVGEIASPDHWVRNMLQPVEFLDSLRNMCINPADSNNPCVDILIEVGPHGALAGPVRQTLQLPELEKAGIAYHSCLTRGQDAIQTMHRLVSSLVQQGYPVDLGAVNFPYGDQGVSVLNDLPAYPWNHETSHWAEPRINREFRTRAMAPHDLLGVPATDFNPMAPSWRHIIRPQDIPWVRDHVVQGSIIYPGAGYICMVVEALRQLDARNASSAPSWYQLQHIRILNPLILDDVSAAGVEVRLSMHPSSDSILQAQGWYDFQIQSVDPQDKWIIHCEGQCSVSTPQIGSGWAGPAYVDPEMDEEETGCWRTIDPANTYKTLHAVGVSHGPIFRNLVSAQCIPLRSRSTFKVADTAACMPYQHQQPHLLHPTTLDSVFQTVYHNLSTGGADRQTAMIPNAIASLQIASSIAVEPGHLFQSRSSLVRSGPNGFESTVRVVDATTAGSHHEPLLKIEGLFCQSLGRTATTNEQDQNLCYQTIWKPDVDFVDPTHLSFSPATTTTAGQRQLSRLQEAVIVFLSKALREINEDSVIPENQAYLAWMRSVVDEASHFLDQNGVSEEYAAALTLGMEQIEEGRFLSRFARELPDILSGKTDPRLVVEQCSSALAGSLPILPDYCSSIIQKLLDLYSHKRPVSKLLEISAGSTQATRMILDALAVDGRAGFSEYDIAIPHPDCMADAMADKLKGYGGRVALKAYSPNEPLEAQGFDPQRYDLIILFSVLCVTRNIKQTLCTIRTLLKPGGKLLVLGPSIQDIAMQMVLKLMPGWKEESLLNKSWNFLLERAGLETEGVQVVQDLNAQSFQGEVFLASSIAKPMAEMSPPEIRLMYSTIPPPEDWVRSLRASLQRHSSYSVSISSFAQSGKAPGCVCVFLDDLVSPILHHPTPNQFDVLRHLLSASRGCLWVSRGAQAESEQPWGALHQGLLRTLRCENATKRYVSLDLDPATPAWTEMSADLVARILHINFYYPSLDNPETEYSVRDNAVQISRVHSSEHESQIVTGSSRPTAHEMEPFFEIEHPIRLGVTTPGLLNSLSFSHDPSVDGPLPENYVEIEPRAFGLNFRDIMVALGELDETRMGFECSGVISHVSPQARAAGFNPGDRVYAFIIGYFANRVRIPYTSVAPIPAGMDFPTAASIPLIFITAYHALYDLARLRSGETVLIHSGTGGVGQAAIMLAQAANAEVFATVGSEEKRDFLIDRYGISPSRIFSSRNESFASHIMQATNGKGVDVVLNSLAGPLLRQSWQCIGTFGRFIEIGKRDIEQNSMVEMGPFIRSVMFASLDLITLGEQRGPEVARIFGEINSLLEAGRIRPVSPITTFSMSEVEKAFRTMQTGKHRGKIVLEPRSGDIIKVLPPSVTPVSLPSDATYIVVGGLGGIGKSVSQFLVDRGARHLVLLSRSVSRLSESNETFIRTLRDRGTTVSLQSCDIADKEQLKAVLDNCARCMPPIKGVIQGAMVLRDSIFEQMTWTSYMAALLPKVQGSWNLHELAPDLDFFVLLSSISGFGGNAGQANYAAGGSFQDALARHRAAQGLPAVSIDLGMVSSVGVVAQDQRVSDHLTKMGLRAVSEEEVLGLVESAIRDPRRTPTTCQVVTGIPSTFTRSDSAVFWNHDARFSNLGQLGDNPTPTSANGSGPCVKARLAASTTLNEASQVIEQAFIVKLADMFSRPESEIEPCMPMSHFGVDSLVAVELRNWLVATLEAECSTFDVMQSSSVTALAAKIAGKSKLVRIG
ncbi:polyketide synthase [Aspergillus sclerotialis]|uniref:Polyketide synthase n=1 Tax=Aspergillus sclerotialis TaxID=2070753 RepID=A0A3A3ACS7_9EURO|nr:polyketide synthase [Aspergillus sclerotialis]